MSMFCSPDMRSGIGFDLFSRHTKRYKINVDLLFSRKAKLPGRVSGQDGIVPILERRCTAVQAYVSTGRGSLLCRSGRRVWHLSQTQTVQDRGYSSKLNSIVYGSRVYPMKKKRILSVRSCLIWYLCITE